MVELRLVCECRNEVVLNRSDTHHTVSNSEGYFRLFIAERYICGECGKDMTLQVVKVESETKETIIS